MNVEIKALVFCPLHFIHLLKGYPFSVNNLFLYFLSEDFSSVIHAVYFKGKCEEHKSQR